MGLVLPTVSVTPGPEYATENNTAFTTVDSHDHTTGKGVPITPSAININADLEFNSNDATELRSTRFDSQSAALATGSDIGCFYNLSGNPTWNNNSGTASRIINTTYPAAVGDLIYASSTTNYTRLTIGSTGQVLKVSGGLPAWASAASTLSVTTQTTTYTIGANDDIILGNPNSASFTMSLPVSSGSGKVYIIKYITSVDLSKVITVARAGSDVIVDAGGSVTSTTLNTIGEEIQIVDAASGTWQIISRRIPSIWLSYTPTFTGFGTVSNTAFYWKRSGDSLLINGSFTTGTVTSADASLTLPSGLTIGSTIPTTTTSIEGQYEVLANGAAANIFSTSAAGAVVTRTGTSTSILYFAKQTASNIFAASNGNAITSTGDAVAFRVFGLSISGWNG
jgi:hypothetical protein